MSQRSVWVPDRPFWRDALHIFAVFNVLIAHTLLERAAQNSWFFVAERARPLDIIVFALLLCLVAPGSLVAIEGLAELVSPRVRNGLHVVLMALLLTTGSFIIVLLRRTNALVPAALGTTAVVLAIASLSISAMAALLYIRSEAGQLFVTFLAIGILVVPGNFLLRSGASNLVFPSGSSADEIGELDAQTPVVVVFFDELPLVSLLDDSLEIDPERYPSFAALSAESHWFRNATGISDASNYAVPAMLSGVYPEVGKLPTDREYPNNLFTMLGNSYEVRAVEPVTQLCPDRMCGDTSPTPREPISLWWGSILAPEIPRPILSPDRPEIFMEHASSIDDTDAPLLYFHHSMLPHSPWLYFPSGRTYTENLVPIGLQVDHSWADDDWLSAQNYQRHLLQLEYTDRLLGELLERLRSVDLYDDALIIVAADHGISFRPGEHSRFISEDNIEHITPVPLLIKQPHQTDGVIDDREVDVVDILPTIADVLEIDLDWDLDGHSLFDESRPEESDRIVFDYSTGDRVTLEPTAERVATAVDDKVSLFGTGADPDALFKMGPYPELVGRDVDQLTIAGSSEVAITLDDPSLFWEVDLNDEFIPAFITGVIGSAPDDIQPDTHLAVAVNGTVRAITRPYHETGVLKFAALVSEDSFRNGENHVEVFIVSGPTEDPEIWRTEG